MNGFESFIVDNEQADVSRLLFSCKAWPVNDDPSLSGLDPKELAVGTIESRRKLRTKVPEWYTMTSLVYPRALSAEQCSSSSAARYKAALAERIIGGKGRIADLTGGMGVDSWAFSGKASAVLYNEMDPALVLAARHNFKELGIENVTVSAREVTVTSIGPLLDSFSPDLVFMDPARRSSEGKKVFLLEDSSPNVLEILPAIFMRCRHLLLKLSPMADISMVVERLDAASGWSSQWVREIHVVSIGGECKELLLWMDREWRGDYEVICAEDSSSMSFTKEEIRLSKGVFPDSAYARKIFEPGKSLSKAGAFNVLCGRFSLVKMARSTNLFILPHDGEAPDALKPFGKIFTVEELLPFNKASVKDLGKRYPRCEVSARNISLSSDELRAKLKVSSGGDVHIFGVRMELPFESGNYLLVCRRDIQ